MLVLVCVERYVLTVALCSVALCRHILEELINGLMEGFCILVRCVHDTLKRRSDDKVFRQYASH